MSHPRFRNFALAGSAAILLMLPGCYTQLGSFRDPREPGYSAGDVQEQEPLADSISDEEYTEARQRFYDESYYPTTVSIGFDYAWGSPWYSRSPWGWYGSSWYGWPGYYDPFYGFNGGYVPIHGYGGGSYYGGYAVRGPRYPAATRRIGPNRTYGSTPGAVSPRTPATPAYTPLPTGVRPANVPASGGASTPPSNTAPASTGRRGVAGERRAPARETPRQAPAPDAGRKSSGNSRGSERPAYTPPPPPPTPAPPPQSQPAPSSGSRGGESREGGGTGGSRGGGRR